MLRVSRMLCWIGMVLSMFKLRHMGKCLAGISAVIMSNFWKAHQSCAWHLCVPTQSTSVWEQGSPGTYTLWLYSQPQSSSITENCITASYMFIYPSRILFSLLSRLIWSKFLLCFYTMTLSWPASSPCDIYKITLFSIKSWHLYPVLVGWTACWFRCQD